MTTDIPTTPKQYTITFNANGGTVDTASKVVDCPFVNWNTNAAGTGTSYPSGGNYTTNAAATLYAQWGYATAGDLPEPTITQGEFTGWFTALHGGTQIIETSDIGSSMTLYARYNYEVTYTSRAYYYPGESDEPVRARRGLHRGHDVLPFLRPHNECCWPCGAEDGGRGAPPVP